MIFGVVKETLETPITGEYDVIVAGDVAVFAVNRGGEATYTEFSLRGFPGELPNVEHIVLADNEIKAANTRDNPNRVVPSVQQSGARDAGVIKIPPYSWNVIRFYGKTVPPR